MDDLASKAVIGAEHAGDEAAIAAGQGALDMQGRVGRRFIAILDCSLVFAAALFAVVLLAASPIGRWEAGTLKRPFGEYGVMTAVPVLVLLVTRSSLTGYGLCVRPPAYHVTVGLTAAVPYAIAHAAPFVLGGQTGTWGGAVDAALMWAALGVVLLLLRGQPSPVPPSMPVGMLLVGLATWRVDSAASGLLFYVLFLGLGEEILFRGYIQSRLSAAFGRPCHVGGVWCGWGVVLAAVYFAAFHVLNLPALAAGDVKLQWSSAMPTLTAGLLFGYLRDKTGSVVAGVVVHGVPQGIASTFFGPAAP